MKQKAHHSTEKGGIHEKLRPPKEKGMVVVDDDCFFSPSLLLFTLASSYSWLIVVLDTSLVSSSHWIIGADRCQ